jgi:selenocysteine-specific elongation factor
MTSAATRPFILGTAGHVDHGKSALVQALTGTDPDRLPEEKLRGITIDLGFAHMTLDAPGDNQPSFSIGIVDVPGHEDFIKNMVAGVGSIDAALLVVAADDGWMPQTEEHLEILTYLGVSAGVVALSKIDLLAGKDAEQHAIASVRARLEGTPLAAVPIIPTSTVTCRGIAELKSAIARELGRLPAPRDIAKPRLPVDRAFMLKGVGTIVTGTLIGGSLSRGQSILVTPHSTPSRIRSIQCHHHDVPTAVPGSRVALNLPDVHPAARGDQSSANLVRRGDVITFASTARSSRHLAVALTQWSRSASVHIPLKHGMRVQLHHATASVSARVRLLKQPTLTPGSRAVAHLTLSLPIVTFAHDRFVLRDPSGRFTLAGGTILDPIAPKSLRRREDYSQALIHLVHHPDDAAAHVMTQLAQAPVLERQGLLAQSNFDALQITDGIARAIATEQCIESGPLLIQTHLWTSLLEGLTTLVNQHHQNHPEQKGLPIAEARAALPRSIPKPLGPALERGLVSQLARLGVIRYNGVLGAASHQPTLPARLREAGESLRKSLGENPLAPPSRKELARTDLTQQALRFLISDGSVVELSPEVVLGADAVAGAIDRIRSYLQSHQTATVSELKTVLNSNRRVMVPLLEHLDRAGVTRREGDLRRLP